jgi:chromatin remodeling complex protein RSC6
MAGKKSTKTETPVTTSEVVVPTEPVVEKKQRKSKKTSEVETVPETQVEQTTTEASEPVEKRRREVSKESHDNDFIFLEQMIQTEIDNLTNSGKKVKGVKWLRGLKKRVGVMHADSRKLLKYKPAGAKKNVSSGFLKPVHISPEMAAFTGWDANKTYSRVDVTKFVCEYVKSKNLFNIKDKREIECDAKLKALLKYDASKVPMDVKTGKPQALTYFRLQQYLKNHFIKNETVPVSTPVTTSSTKSKK